MSRINTARLAVILTCFNRVEKTTMCLSEVYDQAIPDFPNLEVFLVDDGSSDGTADAVREQYPDVHLIVGDGSLFWNMGMHRAFGEALAGEFDYYLWLNDDTHLYEGAIAALLNAHEALSTKGESSSIIVPSTKDPDTGEFSYGGYRRGQSIIHNPLKLDLVGPTDTLEQCDTFCGNCVLIPKEVASRVGNISDRYQHRWGDCDYGFRALEKGCKSWIVPGYWAECESNPLADRWRDSSLSFSDRIAELHSLKGLGKQDWYSFTRRHGGLLWPIIWAKPYLDIAIDSLRNSLKLGRPS